MDPPKNVGALDHLMPKDNSDVKVVPDGVKEFDDETDSDLIGSGGVETDIGEGAGVPSR